MNFIKMSNKKELEEKKNKGIDEIPEVELERQRMKFALDFTLLQAAYVWLLDKKATDIPSNPIELLLGLEEVTATHLRSNKELKWLKAAIDYCPNLQIIYVSEKMQGLLPQWLLTLGQNSDLALEFREES